jgi:hypothetical protein
VSQNGEERTYHCSREFDSSGSGPSRSKQCASSLVPTTLSWLAGSCSPPVSARGGPRFGPASPDRRGPRAGTSSQAPARTPNPRLRVLERPPSPSPNPPPYWSMEPSDRPPLREVTGSPIAPSMVGTLAPTRLRRGRQSSHYRVRGREEKGSPLPKNKTKRIP